MVLRHTAWHLHVLYVPGCELLRHMMRRNVDVAWHQGDSCVTRRYGTNLSALQSAATAAGSFVTIVRAWNVVVSVST